MRRKSGWPPGGIRTPDPKFAFKATKRYQDQLQQDWGAKVIDRLAQDLKGAFPDMRGWASRNLKYMAFFAQHCPDGLFGQQAAAQLP